MPEGDGLAASLALYTPASARRITGAESELCYLSHPDIHVAVTPEGAVQAVLFGWIDDADDRARELGLSPHAANAADIYHAALARHGVTTDDRLTGNYCALVITGGGRLRLSRSAWNAPPLYLTRLDGTLVVSPHIRALQAAGAATDPDPERLRDALAFDFHEIDSGTLYRGIERVRLGSAVLAGAVASTSQWSYDPASVPIRDAIDDDAAVEQALDLLDRAVNAAAARCESPAVALSAGLDSPLVAARLAHGRAPRTLPTITLRPHPRWRSGAEGTAIHDEWPRVQAFAALHPAIVPHWVDSERADFDTLAREIFRASRVFTPGLANVGAFAPLWIKARALGSDCLLDAELGNQSFSARGEWGFREALFGMRLPGLLRDIRGTRPDQSTLARHAYTQLASPLLPERGKALARSLLGKPAAVERASMLRPRHRSAHAEARGHGASAWDQGWAHLSRGEQARLDHAVCDRGAADVTLALQEIHGVRSCDATAYRPLIEFCLSLPTSQFLHEGVDRRLARRMAKGIVPEEQRREKAMATHNVDWAERIGARREELSAYAETMRGDPLLGELVDVDRLQALLANWDAKGPVSPMEGWFGVTSAVLAGQFLGAIGGRNDL